MVGDINEGEKDAEVVFALEITNASVYVFRMETVVFETEVEYGVSNDLCANGLFVMMMKDSHLKKSAHVVKPRT